MVGYRKDTVSLVRLNDVELRFENTPILREAFFRLDGTDRVVEQSPGFPTELMRRRWVAERFELHPLHRLERRRQQRRRRVMIEVNRKHTWIVPGKSEHAGPVIRACTICIRARVP